MRKAKIIAIGDNVADQYLSRGKMYPGGQCVNTCAYSCMNGGEPAYLGKFGDDAVAAHNCEVLTQLGIDFSHSRHFHGENGAAKVTLIDGERVFLGSNKGGVAKEHPYDFTDADLDYIRQFDVIYTNGNSYITDDLPLLYATGVPIAYDFSDNFTIDDLESIGRYVKIALLSCSHLSKEKRRSLLQRVSDIGVTMAVATMGEEGAEIYYGGDYIYAPAVKAETLLDTMGAGDAYFATLLTTLLKDDAELFSGDQDQMQKRILYAMKRASEFACRVVGMEGAFGYAAPIPE